MYAFCSLIPQDVSRLERVLISFPSNGALRYIIVMLQGDVITRFKTPTEELSTRLDERSPSHDIEASMPEPFNMAPNLDCIQPCKTSEHAFELTPKLSC